MYVSSRDYVVARLSTELINWKLRKTKSFQERQTVLFHSMCASLVWFLCWAAFILPGLRLLSRSGLKNSSLLVGTAAFTERSSVSRHLEQPAGCFNSADVAAARGNRSSAVCRLIFILFLRMCSHVGKLEDRLGRLLGLPPTMLPCFPPFVLEHLWLVELRVPPP